MTFYEFLLLVDLARRAEKADDPVALGALVADMSSLAGKLFISRPGPPGRRCSVS